ncbi:Putative zinc finger protein 876 [Fukomys damarensis]|uniref:Putative zinc finger protein 876 n=1 Tax=Fukomys damarensis TaxID=885580 RepID=A0A091DYR9_FUKDA|nr:Putative zinc finger protein 876 [Fukomys damarensis]
MLERNATRVKNVAEPLLSAQTLVNTDFTLVRNPTSGRAFGVSSNLTQHQPIHTGEKCYQCQERDKGFDGPFQAYSTPDSSCCRDKDTFSGGRSSATWKAENTGVFFTVVLGELKAHEWNTQSPCTDPLENKHIIIAVTVTIISKECVDEIIKKTE